MSLAEPIEANLLPSASQIPNWQGPISTPSENFVSTFKSMNEVNSTMGLQSMWEDELQKRDDQIFNLTGKRFGVTMANPKFANQYGPFQSVDDQVDSIADQYPSNVPHYALRKAFDDASQIEGKIDELRKTYPEIKSRADIFKDVSARRGEIQMDAAEISARSGTAGAVAGFAGGMAGGLTMNNPEALASLPFGGVGKSVLTRIGTEALVQMTVAGVQQAKVSKDYASMGEELTAAQQAENILYAGAGGAAFRGVGEVAGPAIAKGKTLIGQALAERAKAKDATGKLADELINADDANHQAAILERADAANVAEINAIVNPVQSTAQRGAVAAAEVEDFTAKLNPFEDTAATDAGKMHDEMLQTVGRALEQGKPIPQEPQGMPALVNDIYKRVPVETFPVEDLTVDAPAMQFKGGGDESGVTDRLKGTRAWSDYLAGVITVWKKDDGTTVVADGHQRVGFAKRLMAENPDQKISIPAFVFKESDGDTQGFVRAAAALRNISEGSGTALDASKVFKDMPEKAKTVFDSLPPNSAIVRQGLDLAALDNEAYLMVVNGVVDEKIAAVVGRLESDHNQQRALMALMAHEEPDTIFQAEQIVRQAQQAGFHTSEQATLFGTDTITESLFKDKAKVLERGLNMIKSDVKTFRNLMNNSERISQVGNQLNSTANAAILGDANTILQTVQALAYRKGPIADLLTQAAKEAKQNGRYKQGAERFVAALRNRLDEGGVSGLFDASEGDVSNAIAEVTRRIESENIAANIEATSDLFTDQPKTITENFNQLKMARDVQDKAAEVLARQTTPAARTSAAEAGSAPSKTPISASGAATQALEAGSKRLATKEPLDAFSTAKMAPEILTGGKAKLGIRDSSNNAVVYHADGNKATLLQKAEKYKESVGEFLSDSIKDIRGAEYMDARVKKAQDVQNKIDMLGRRPEQVSDYLGARIQVDSIKAARDVQAALGERAHVVETDDFLENARQGGDYHAVHMQLMTKDGFTYEVQIVPRDLMDVYDKARGSYADWKGYRGEIPADKKAQYIADKTKGDKVFRDAWRKFQERDLVEKQIAEFNVNDDVPVSIEFDSMGNEVVKTAKLGELMAEIEAHESLLENMTKCLI